MCRDLDRVAAKLGGAARITVLTGAGVSAASGVPTFRGEDGLRMTAADALEALKANMKD